MTRFTLALVSAACLFAQALPVAMTNPAVVYVEKKPLMWTECSQTMKVERDRICSARKKSERTRL
jgi:hypothetical protein